ncbi:unnamed protein product [Symbiodinium sp. CCMP2592]|nr:unnamed protein product [Symbiodinium sp. CCMP2592]
MEAFVASTSAASGSWSPALRGAVDGPGLAALRGAALGVAAVSAWACVAPRASRPRKTKLGARGGDVVEVMPTTEINYYKRDQENASKRVIAGGASRCRAEFSLYCDTGWLGASWCLLLATLCLSEQKFPVALVGARGWDAAILALFFQGVIVGLRICSAGGPSFLDFAYVLSATDFGAEVITVFGGVRFAAVILGVGVVKGGIGPKIKDQSKSQGAVKSGADPRTEESFKSRSAKKGTDPRTVETAKSYRAQKQEPSGRLCSPGPRGLPGALHCDRCRHGFQDVLCESCGLTAVLWVVICLAWAAGPLLCFEDKTAEVLSAPLLNVPWAAQGSFADRRFIAGAQCCDVSWQAAGGIGLSLGLPCDGFRLDQFAAVRIGEAAHPGPGGARKTARKRAQKQALSNAFAKGPAGLNALLKPLIRAALQEVLQQSLGGDGLAGLLAGAQAFEGGSAVPPRQVRVAGPKGNGKQMGEGAKVGPGPKGHGKPGSERANAGSGAADSRADGSVPSSGPRVGFSWNGDVLSGSKGKGTGKGVGGKDSTGGKGPGQPVGSVAAGSADDAKSFARIVADWRTRTGQRPSSGAVAPGPTAAEDWVEHRWRARPSFFNCSSFADCLADIEDALEAGAPFLAQVGAKDLKPSVSMLRGGCPSGTVLLYLGAEGADLDDVRQEFHVEPRHVPGILKGQHRLRKCFCILIDGSSPKLAPAVDFVKTAAPRTKDRPASVVMRATFYKEFCGDSFQQVKAKPAQAIRRQFDIALCEATLSDRIAALEEQLSALQSARQTSLAKLEEYRTYFDSSLWSLFEGAKKQASKESAAIREDFFAALLELREANRSVQTVILFWRQPEEASLQDAPMEREDGKDDSSPALCSCFADGARGTQVEASASTTLSTGGQVFSSGYGTWDEAGVSALSDTVVDNLLQAAVKLKPADPGAIIDTWGWVTRGTDEVTGLVRVTREAAAPLLAASGSFLDLAASFCPVNWADFSVSMPSLLWCDREEAEPAEAYIARVRKLATDHGLHCAGAKLAARLDALDPRIVPKRDGWELRGALVEWHLADIQNLLVQSGFTDVEVRSRTWRRGGYVWHFHAVRPDFREFIPIELESEDGAEMICEACRCGPKRVRREIQPVRPERTQSFRPAPLADFIRTAAPKAAPKKAEQSSRKLGSSTEKPMELDTDDGEDVDVAQAKDDVVGAKRTLPGDEVTASAATGTKKPKSVPFPSTAQVIPNKGGGDCLFHALAQAVGEVEGRKIGHRQVRAALADWVAANAETLKPHWDGLGPDSKDLQASGFTAYCDAIRMQGSWGGYLEIFATSVAHGLNVLVLCRDAVHKFPANAQDRGHYIVLKYDAAHYEYVRVESKDIANLWLSAVVPAFHGHRGAGLDFSAYETGSSSGSARSGGRSAAGGRSTSGLNFAAYDAGSSCASTAGAGGRGLAFSRYAASSSKASCASGGKDRKRLCEGFSRHASHGSCAVRHSSVAGDGGSVCGDEIAEFPAEAGEGPMPRFPSKYFVRPGLYRACCDLCPYVKETTSAGLAAVYLHNHRKFQHGKAGCPGTRKANYGVARLRPGEVAAWRCPVQGCRYGITWTRMVTLGSRTTGCKHKLAHRLARHPDINPSGGLFVLLRLLASVHGPGRVR